MLTSKPSKVAKVVICGMKSVGKTAILEQLIYGSITPDTVRLLADYFYAKFYFTFWYGILFYLFGITFSWEIYVEFSFNWCLTMDFSFVLQELHPTIEDTFEASVDTGRGSRDILRIYDTAGLQGTVQVIHYEFDSLWICLHEKLIGAISDINLHSGVSNHQCQWFIVNRLRYAGKVLRLNSWVWMKVHCLKEKNE